MKTLRLGELDAFPLIDPPKPDAVRDGYRTLFELGAIDEQQELTEIGRRLGRLPVNPRIGRMILAAGKKLPARSTDHRCGPGGARPA